MRNNILFVFVIIYGSLTFVASVITGLIGGVSFGILVFRAIMFFILGAGVFYGMVKVFSLLFHDIRVSTKHSEEERTHDQEDGYSTGSEIETGQHVNIVLDDTHTHEHENSVNQDEPSATTQEFDGDEIKDISMNSPFSDEKITYNIYNDDNNFHENEQHENNGEEKDIQDDVKVNDNFSELITEQGLHNIPKVEKSEAIHGSGTQENMNEKDVQKNSGESNKNAEGTHIFTDMQKKTTMGATKPVRNQVLDVEIEKVSHQYRKSPEIFTRAVATLMKKDDNS